mgnify:CR=1 FL=1
MVVQNSYFSEYLPQVAKDIKIIPVKSVQEGLKKLSAGEGDYFVGFYIIFYYIFSKIVTSKGPTNKNDIIILR